LDVTNNTIMIQATLFFYNLKDIEPRIRTKVHEELFDRMKKSNYSTYAYKIQGVLSTFDYIRPVRAALIVKPQYAQRIMDIFEKNGVTYRSYTVSIPSRDFEKSTFF
jgi:hypothetical protein